MSPIVSYHHKSPGPKTLRNVSVKTLLLVKWKDNATSTKTMSKKEIVYRRCPCSLI